MKAKQILTFFAALAFSWPLMAATLQSFVNEEHVDGDIILVPDGEYEPSDLSQETRRLTFRAENEGEVIIDGGTTTRCVDLSDSITLEGFLLRNGKAEQGGGVRGGTIVRTTVQNCTAIFGGGAYKTNIRASIFKHNSAEFFGTAAYGGTAFSSRFEENTSASYGGGMATLFGVTTANCAIVNNRALHDVAGTMASPVQNMVYYANVAERGNYEGSPTKDIDAVGGAPEGEAFKSVSGVDIFTNVAIGDYTLDVTKAAEHVKEKADPSLGGNYDVLWYDKDLAGRPRLLAQALDIGPYEIADTITVTCEVKGVGEVAVVPTEVQEGDPVTFTATSDTYQREFIGYYVNDRLVSTEATMTYAPLKEDKIVARFAGLTLDPANEALDTLEEVIAALHPSILEEVTLTNGTFAIPALDKPVAFVGASTSETTVNLSGDCKGAYVINATVTGADVSNVTLHRCLVNNFSGANVTLTSSIIASTCTNISGKAVNTTAWNAMPAGLTQVDCVVLSGTTNTVTDAILLKNDTNIDAGQGGSDIIPYDNFDIAGRPRVSGTKVDCGAHECNYITVSVAAEGYYAALSPTVGTYDKLTGDILTLSYESPRTFRGWRLADGTVLTREPSYTYVLPEGDCALTASFEGFALTPESTIPNDTTAADTIVLAPGIYTQDFTTAATIVGTGLQDEVVLTGTIAGGARLEAVSFEDATLSNVTLNRCYVSGGSATNVTAYNSILVNLSSATGTYINNTTVNTTLPETAKNTRVLNAIVEDYTPPQEEADKGGSLTNDERLALGDYDYYGNPRVNNATIDNGAVEYEWPPYIVTIDVIGHGFVEPRGAVEVVRGAPLTFTVKQDPKHPRDLVSVSGAEDKGNGIYSIYPNADATVTVTFEMLPEVTTDDALQAALVEAQDGETITVAPGTYGAIDVKGKRLKIVASDLNPANTIIDASWQGRAVTLTEGAEIIGFTIQNGIANKGAGVYQGTVRRCIIQKNTLTYNGFGAGVCEVFAESCLIVDNGSENVVRSNGGGASTSDLLNCTVVRNIADKGAGLYDCTAKNCVIALNTDLAGAVSDWAGDSVAPDPTDCCTPTTGGITVDAGTLFVDPENNDWRLREGIACIDAGTNDDRLSEKDVTGAVRVYDDAVDMGAIEWNSPDYNITIAFQGRGIATVDGTEIAWDAEASAKVLSVSRTKQTLSLQWKKDAATSVDRTFVGIMANNAMLDGSANAVNEAFTWTIAAEDTVNVMLTFIAEDLSVTTAEELTAALESAIAGETIKLAEGNYDVAVDIGTGVIVDGASKATLLQGATLADGAVLKRVTVTGAGVSGPETGRAELIQSIVTGVTGVAVKQNVVLKTCAVYENTIGVMDSTAYLSTIVSNAAAGVGGASHVYGTVVWGNGVDVEESVLRIDSYVGGNPKFTLPAPDGEDYTVLTQSPLIDLAATAQWEGFTDADRSLADLAGNARPALNGYDIGAYELQVAADPFALWTWYGSAYTVDGTWSGSNWRKMIYGAPYSLPANASACFVDRDGFASADVAIDSVVTIPSLQLENAKSALAFRDAGGRLTVNSGVIKSSSGSLSLAAQMDIKEQLYLSAGALTVEEGASVAVDGKFVASSIPVTMTGGTLSAATKSDLFGTTQFTLTGGTFEFGDYLNIRDSVFVDLAGGTVTGGEISVAQDARDALRFSGADVTVSKIETGDESSGRYGNIVQTGGTLTVTGSGSGKSAPLHISHWSGWSNYTMTGGQLFVPNGEVRIGQDGNGHLILSGGYAEVKSIGITNGKVTLAGGTLKVLTTQTLPITFTAGTASRVIAPDAESAYLQITPSEAGDIIFGESLGYFQIGTSSEWVTVTNNNLIFENGVRLSAKIALTGTGKEITVPGSGTAPVITSGSFSADQIAFSGDLPDGETLVLSLKVPTSHNTITAEQFTVTGRWAGNCSLRVAGPEEANGYAIYNVYATRTGTPAVVGTPTLTLTGGTTEWTSNNWSPAFVAGEDAIVRVVEDSTLDMDAYKTVNNLTIEIAEGKALTIAKGSSLSAAGTVTLVGGGTLRLENAFFYGSIATCELAQIISNVSSQEWQGTALNGVPIRVEQSATLSNLSEIDLSIAEGVTVGLPTTCRGLLVSDGACTLSTDSATTFTGEAVFGGAVTLAWNTTFNGSLVLGALPATSEKVFYGDVEVALPEGVDLTIPSGQMASGAYFKKTGEGKLTLSDASYNANLRLGGVVEFTQDTTINGALHIEEGSVVFLPYDATLIATGEVRIEPSVRFILTTSPEANVTLADAYTLLSSNTAAGLVIDQLATLSVMWQNIPADEMLSNPQVALAGDTLVYTLTRESAKVWTGATSSDWSTASNWSDNAVPEADDTVRFTDAAATKTVELSSSVPVGVMTFASGDYTLSGGVNLNSFTGKTDVNHLAGTTAWVDTFIERGVYTIYAGAKATLAQEFGYVYKGSFAGEGALELIGGSFTLAAASVGYSGAFTVGTDTSLTLVNAESLYAATVNVAGTLAVESDASVATVVMEDGGQLRLSKDYTFTVREEITGDVAISIATLPDEVGDWEIMALPMNTAASFTLLNETSAEDKFIAFLSQSEDRLILSLRPTTDIAWASKNVTTGADVWNVYGTPVATTVTAGKRVWLTDVEGVPAATISLPENPSSVMVEAVETVYTINNATAVTMPMTVMASSQVVLRTNATLSELSNGGVITVQNATLDLTETQLVGRGKVIAGTGSIVRISAQTLAESTMTFSCEGGKLEVVTTEDFSMPTNRIPDNCSGLIKEGEGTLYLPPAAMSSTITVNNGVLMPTGAIALKARYFKFEPHERFAGSAWWLPATGLSDFVTTLSGERQAWPEGSTIVRFDSGVTNKIQIGITGDSQSYIDGISGKIANVFDNDLNTQLLWNDWHDSYGTGDKWRRNYFVIDAGEQGFKFTGYNVGTPDNLDAFFWKWSVAVANDISNWRPNTELSTKTADEDTIWQTIDERTFPEDKTLFKTSAWMNAGEYAARRQSGFWSEYTGSVNLASASAVLDLSKAVGTSGILQDEVEMATVSGVGTLKVPTSLKVTADTLSMNTLHLTGTDVLKTPISVKSTAVISTITMDEAVSAAYNESPSADFVLIEGYTGTIAPTLSGMQDPGDGGTWQLAVIDGNLHLGLANSPRFLATTLLSESENWSSLAWTDILGNPIEPDWAAVEEVTIKMTSTSPDKVTLTLPSGIAVSGIERIVFDFGDTESKRVCLTGSGTLQTKVLEIKGEHRGTLLPDSTTLLTAESLEVNAPEWDTSPKLLDMFGGSSASWRAPNVPMGIIAKTTTEALASKVLGTALITVREGTLKLRKEEQFDSMTRELHVAAGATLDVNGCPISNNLTLQGGTLTNSGAGIGTGKRQNYNITLTADSVISGVSDYYSLNNGYNVHTLTLNGHTLTKRGTCAFGFYNANIEGGDGTIVVEAGTLRVQPHNSNVLTLKDVTFVEQGGTVEISAPVTLSGTVTLDGGICSAAVTVAADSKVRGTGTIAGALTLNSGAKIEVYSLAEPLKLSGDYPATITMSTMEGLEYPATVVPILSIANATEATRPDVTLENLPGSRKLEWNEDYTVLNVVPQDALSTETTVKATLSGDANWSTLNWTDSNGVGINPDWRIVTNVTLTATADAIITRDVATEAITSLTIAESSFKIDLQGTALTALTTLAANGDVSFGPGMLTTMPTALSGDAEITFYTDVATTLGGGGTTYAYNDFTGRWIIEDGATLTIGGEGGGKMGQLNWNSAIADSGQIEVRQGGTLTLGTNHAFGWADGANQRNRTVLVVDGGRVVCDANYDQYVRRTFELKNGAELYSSATTPGKGISLGRDTNILVTEGEASLTGTMFIGCDSQHSNQQNILNIIAQPGATLKIPASINNGANQSNADVDVEDMKFSGGGTIVLSGTTLNSYTRMQVAADTTLLVNGTVSFVKPITFEANAIVGGTGSIAPVSTYSSTASVTFSEGTKIKIVDETDPLSIQVGAYTTFTPPSGGIGVIFPEDMVSGNSVKVLTSTSLLATSDLSVPDGYATTVETSGSWYTLVCSKTSLDQFPTILADVSGEMNWDALTWQNESGASLDSSLMDWNVVTTAVLRVNDNTILTLPENIASGNQIATLKVEFVKEGSTLTFAGATASVPAIQVIGVKSGRLATTATALTATALSVESGVVGLDVATLNAITSLSDSVTYTFYGDGTLNKVLPGTTPVTIASGTVKPSAANQISGRMVTINSGATLDVNGFAQACTVTLAGGTLTNTGAALSDQSAWQTYGITLTADSTIGGTADMRSLNTNWAAHTIALGSRTLTLDNASTLYWTNASIENGAIQVARGTLDIGYGWDKDNGWAKKEAEATLRNVTLTVAEGAKLTLNRGMTIEGTVVFSEGATFNKDVTISLTQPDEQTASLTVPTSAITGETSIEVDTLTLTGTAAPAVLPTFTGMTVNVGETLKTAIAAATTARISLATLEGNEPVVNNVPDGWHVEIADNTLGLANNAFPTHLVTTCTGSVTWDDLPWTNASSQTEVVYANVDKELVTAITLKVQGDATLFVADIKALFPNVETLNVVYETADALLTFAGDAIVLPALALSGENGSIHSTATTIAIDGMTSSQAAVGLGVGILNVVSWTSPMPTLYRLYGNGETLNKELPEVATPLTTYGDITLAKVPTGSAAITIASGKLTFEPSESEVTLTTPISGGSLACKGTTTYTIAAANRCVVTTLEIGAETVVKATAQNALQTTTITGEGTLIGVGHLVSGTVSEDWTGVVRFEDVASYTYLNLSNYGNAQSKIELKDLGTANGNVYLVNSTYEVTADLKLEGANYINNGFYANSYTFSGDLTGNGSLTWGTYGTPNDCYFFTGDLSGFTGSLTQLRANRIVLGNNTNVTQDALTIDGTTTWNGTLTANADRYIRVMGSAILSGSGTLASDVTFHAGATLDVTAGTNLTVAEGKTVTLPDALTVKLPVDAEMPVTILSTTAFAGSEGLDDCVVTVEGAEGAFRLRKTATALQVDEVEELDTLTIDATTGAVWSTIAEQLENSKQALSANATLTINFGDGDTPGSFVFDNTEALTFASVVVTGSAGGTVTSSEGALTFTSFTRESACTNLTVDAKVFTAAYGSGAQAIDGWTLGITVPAEGNVTLSNAFTVNSNATFKKVGAGTLSLTSTSNTLHGGLDVKSGTLILASADRGIKGDVVVAQGATLATTANDAINYSASSTQTITINGTVQVGAKWTIFDKNKIVLGAGAVLDTYNNFAKPLDFYRANCPISVTGADAIIRAVMFNHDNNTSHSVKITFAEGASLTIEGNVETIPVTTELAEGATSATLKLTGTKSSTSQLTIGNGITLAGDGTWSGPATFNGGKIQVTNLEQPITIKGAVTASQPIEVLFDETAEVPVKVLVSTTALTEDLLAVRVGYSRVMETTEGEPTTYTLCYDEADDTDVRAIATTINETVEWSALAWTNIESGNTIDLNTVTAENITSVTLNVTETATLTLADVKTAFPNAVVTINYTAQGKTLTLTGESVVLPAITVTGESGMLKTTATSLVMDALSVVPMGFGFDVALLNSATTLTTLPTAYTLYGDGSTLTKTLPATATVTLQSGTIKLGANNVLNTANTIILNADATLDLNGKEHDGSLTLNGGKLTNTGNVLGMNLQQLRNLVLTADSEIEVNDGHAFHLIHSGYGVQTLTLNAHTLTKSGTGTMAWCNVSPANGTVKVTNGTLEMRSGNNGTGANNTCTLTAVTLEENGGEIQITRNYALADTVTLKGEISIASVLSGDGALNVDAGTLTLSGANTYTGGTQIAEGAKVIATSIGTGEVTGAGDIELLINATAVSVPNIVKVAYTGAATLTASGDNGAIVENMTNVTWPSGKQYIFNGGTHALTFYPGALPEDKSTETEDSASIQVKANTTLTLKARDFGGWTGSHFNNIALSVKGENAKVIAASFDTNPGCFTGRVYLADGATIQGGDNSTDAINFFGNADDANIHVTSGSASWTNKLWIGNGGGGNITNLGITVEEAASFDLSALVQNNKGIKKCGAGAMTLSGENTSTGSLIVNEGTAVITGAWAGATSVAADATLTGTGTIGGTLTFAEGATFKVDPSAANPLKVTGTISGTATIALAETQEVISKIALIASNETIDPANFGAIPGYTYVVETVDGVHTLYAAVAAPEALTATLSGNVAWADVPWMSDESIAIDPETVDVSQVTTITLNLTADATLTFGDVQATFPALTTVKVNPMAENLTFTIAGDRVTLPTVTTDLFVQPTPMVFLSTATSLTIEKFQPKLSGEYAVGIGVSFLNSCTVVNLPTTYRLFGDGSVLTKQVSESATGIQLANGIVKIANSDILQSRPLFVEQGATFDLNGNTHLGSLTLNGGKLTNTGNAIGTNEQQLRDLVLTADSEIEVNEGHVFHLIDGSYALQTLTLNGHTLTKSGTGKMQWCNVSPDGGTITVTGGILLMRAGGQAENGTDHAADTCTLTAVTLEENGGEIQITRNYALADTVTLKGDISIASVLSGDGALNVATGSTTLSGANTYTGNTTIAEGATLKVTTKDALGSTRNGSGQIALGSTTLTGAGSLELAFADAEASLEMIGNGGTFTGDIIVTGGTLKFPNGSGGSGPVHGRVITVTGANAILTTGTNSDATGWNVSGRQKLVLADGAQFKVYKRDTFKTPLEMTGASVILMNGANDGGRGLDWYQSPSLTVKALEGATAESPTESFITVAADATANDQKINIRDDNGNARCLIPADVEANARLTIDAHLYGDDIVKTGEGELVLTNATNAYNATTINGGTLTVTGATGTGATTMAVGTTLRGTGTVKGALTFTNTLAEDGTTVSAMPTLIVDAASDADPVLTVNGAITGKVSVRFTTAITTQALVPVLHSSQAIEPENFMMETALPEGYALQVIEDEGLYTLAVAKENFQIYTELHATVTENAAWTALSWTDGEGNAVESGDIAWSLVETVVLTAENGAVVTMDAALPVLTALTIEGGSLTLQNHLETKLSASTALAVNNGASIKLVDVYASSANITPTGTGAITWAPVEAVTHTGKFTLPATISFITEGDLTLNNTGNVFNGSLTVASGTLTLATASQGLAGDLIVAPGATLVGSSNDAPTYSKSTTITVNGTLRLAEGIRWTIGDDDTLNPMVLGGGARLEGTGNAPAGCQTTAFDFFNNNATLKVTGENAVIAGLMGAHTGTKTLNVTFTDGASLILEGGVVANAYSINTALEEDATAATLTITGEKAATGTLTIGAGITLTGTGSWAGTLAFTEGATLAVANPDEVLSVTGAVTGTAAVILPEGVVAPEDEERLTVLFTESTASTVSFTYGNGSTHIVVPEATEGGVNYNLVRKPTYSALSATVTGNANWSELTWMAGETVVTNPVWGAVTAVTLTAEADATVTRDVATLSLTSLTVAASENTLTMAGASLDGVALTLNGDLAIAEATTLTTLTTLEGAGTLKLMAGVTVTVNHTTDNTSLLSGKKVDIAEGATLVLTANGNRKLEDNVNFSGITGTGKIVYQNNGWMTLPKAANMFATTLEVENNLSNGLILPEVGKAFQIGSLSGNGAFRVDFNNGDPRSLEIIQSKDTTYSGGMLTNNATDRLSSFYLSGIDGATLTYTGTTTVAKPLVINASGSLNLTGTWTGPMTVNGKLAGSGTINGAVTFEAGAVVVADGQALTLGTVTAESTFVEVTASLVTADDAVTAFTATSALDVNQYAVAPEYALEVVTATEGETTTYALVVKRASFVTLTGTEDFAAETQQVVRDIVIEALKAESVTEGAYAVDVEVYTKGSETPKTPTADEVDALLGCFINVETVEVNTETNTAKVKIAYEFGLADVTVDADLNVIFKALVERVDEARNDERGLADYADGVTFSITDTLSGEVWDIADENVEAPQDEVGAVYLMLPDAYEVEGQQRSVLTNFIGTRKFKVRVKR